MKQLFILSMMMLLTISCQQMEKNRVAKEVISEMSAKANYRSDEAPPPPPPAEEARFDNQRVISDSIVKKKIIKDGRMGIKVSDLARTKLQIDVLVKKHGGYFDSESFTNSDSESAYNLKIRIPENNFEKFLTEIEAEDGEILYKEIDARDVTDQFIDLGTRLKTKRNYLTRYSELLKQAKTVKDILEIEEKVRGLEEEIESTVGKLKYLNDLVNYSSLELSITKPKDIKFIPAQRDPFYGELKLSLSNGWFGFVDFLLFLLKLWPFWLIAGFLAYFWKKLNFKRKGKVVK